MSSKIHAISVALPEHTLTNEDLANQFSRWKPEKITKKLGIQQRHIVAEGETALDLAEQACISLFEKVDPQCVDFLLLCTQSPEYYLPSTSCILQERLHLRKNIGALDYNLGCSGYVVGLSMAKGLISSGAASNVLLVTSETYSKHIHPGDLANRTVFGDAATATLVTSSDEEQLHAFSFGTDGSGYDRLIVPNGGMRNKYDPNAEPEDDGKGNLRTPNNLFMDGPEIFNFTIEAVPILVDDVLKQNEMTRDDVDYFIFHQANKHMLMYLQEITNIPPEKFYLDMLNTGNTVSSTIPIGISKCLQEGTIHKGDKVMLVGFGVGYSWAGTIITV